MPNLETNALKSKIPIRNFEYSPTYSWFCDIREMSATLVEVEVANLSAATV